MKLETWKEMSKSDFICKYDGQLMLILFGLGALFYDLGLDNVSNFCIGIVLLMFGWWTGQFITLVVIRIIEKKRTNKSNIEKVIDEEIKKGN